MATPEQHIAAEVIYDLHKKTVRELREKSEAFDDLKGPEARAAYLLYRHAAQILDSMNWTDVITMVIANDQASDEAVAERVKRRVDESRKRSVGKALGFALAMAMLIGGCESLSSDPTTPPPLQSYANENLLPATRISRTQYTQIYRIEVEPGKSLYVVEGDNAGTPVSMVIDKESHETLNQAVSPATR